MNLVHPDCFHDDDIFKHTYKQCHSPNIFICSASPVSEQTEPYQQPDITVEEKNPSKMSSKCRQNYHEDFEALVNQQINIELKAYYQYLALVSWDKIQKLNIINYFEP